MTSQKSQWDVGRFLQTLNYFETIPIISDLQKLFAGNKKNTSRKPMGMILVVGATGGVGKRVVRLLLAKGYQVRALAREAQKAKELFKDSKVEIFEGDLTIPETLTPKLMEGVEGIICCSGVRVQPVEGDTKTREKYYQGIKFYMPEVVDSPELVDYQGIKNLVQLANKSLRAGVKTLFDFTRPNPDLKEIWGALDDVVMGGVSESNIKLLENRAFFSGVVRTENNGGFVSVRTKNFDSPIDLSGYEGIELRVKGDGKRYKFFIRSENKWDGVGYAYSFDTVHNYWTTVEIPFSNLIPVFRAKTVPSMGDFDASRVYSMQLMLSKFEYDGALNPHFAPGLFSLEIESIKAYGGNVTPQFIMISSAGVTRPGRPGLNLEEEPPAVRLNDQLGGILTWKLRGEDALRQSGLSYTIIRPCALTEKPGDKALVFDQGDNIRGQVSRDAIASLCVETLTLPEAVNKTFEVREESDRPTQTNYPQLLTQLQTDP